MGKKSRAKKIKAKAQKKANNNTQAPSVAVEVPEILVTPPPQQKDDNTTVETVINDECPIDDGQTLPRGPSPPPQQDDNNTSVEKIVKGDQPIDDGEAPTYAPFPPPRRRVEWTEHQDDEFTFEEVRDDMNRLPPLRPAAEPTQWPFHIAFKANKIIKVAKPPCMTCGMGDFSYDKELAEMVKKHYPLMHCPKCEQLFHAREQCGSAEGWDQTCSPAVATSWLCRSCLPNPDPNPDPPPPPPPPAEESSEKDPLPAGSSEEPTTEPMSGSDVFNVAPTGGSEDVSGNKGQQIPDPQIVEDRESPVSDTLESEASPASDTTELQEMLTSLEENSLVDSDLVVENRINEDATSTKVDPLTVENVVGEESLQPFEPPQKSNGDGFLALRTADGNVINLFGHVNASNDNESQEPIETPDDETATDDLTQAHISTVDPAVIFARKAEESRSASDDESEKASINGHDHFVAVSLEARADVQLEQPNEAAVANDIRLNISLDTKIQSNGSELTEKSMTPPLSNKASSNSSVLDSPTDSFEDGQSTPSKKAFNTPVGLSPEQNEPASVSGPS
jgi:hypothetical protein